MSKSLGELVATLTEAQKSYEDSKREESVARSRACTCLNRLNDAQKALDAAVAELRKKVASLARFGLSAG